MTKKILLSLAAASLAVGGAGIAYADHHRGKHNPDTDGDGLVTLSEAQAHGATMFARLDANNDGVVNQADRAARQAERFTAMDANNDGEVTQAEMQAAREALRADRAERRADRMAERFARLDTDNSGGLSQAEMQAGHEARKERRGEGGKMHRRGSQRGGKGMGMMMLRMADTDGDKSVTRAEFDAAVAQHFATVDSDGNGSITAEERDAARAKMREQRRSMRQTG